jgi:hypothetical protein
MCKKWEPKINKKAFSVLSTFSASDSCFWCKKSGLSEQKTGAKDQQKSVQRFINFFQPVTLSFGAKKNGLNEQKTGAKDQQKSVQRFINFFQPVTLSFGAKKAV